MFNYSKRSFLRVTFGVTDRLREAHSPPHLVFSVVLALVHSHLVLSELTENPALHRLHMAAPCLGQATPVVGAPLSHTHMVTVIHRHKRTHVYTTFRLVTRLGIMLMTVYPRTTALGFSRVYGKPSVTILAHGRAVNGTTFAGDWHTVVAPA